MWGKLNTFVLHFKEKKNPKKELFEETTQQLQSTKNDKTHTIENTKHYETL